MTKPKKTVVRNWPEAMTAIMNRRYKLSGVDGCIHVHIDSRHHYHVSHEASAAGRKSKAYLAEYKARGAHFFTHLKDRPTVSKILAELGIVIEP